MLIIGDHKQTDRKFKYENYPTEKRSDFNKKRSLISNQRKMKITTLDPKVKRIDYTIWLKSLNKTRLEYLKRIGIKDQKQLQTLIKMSFNILPYDIRSNLQREIAK